MRIVAIIQARMGSARLPGKVMLDLAGEPMLARCVVRAQRALTLHAVVVATTLGSADERIVRLCARRGWPCFRGSQEDVLDRYRRAAMEHRADLVVRMTSDCPLIEPEIIDRVVGEYQRHAPLDYASNILPPRTFPRGLDVEVMAFEALERAWREDRDPAWREHVTPYLYRHPEIFRLHGVHNDADLSDLRWTVDTPEDLAFARRVYDHFGHDRFSWQEVLQALRQHPEWTQINRHVPQKVL